MAYVGSHIEIRFKHTLQHFPQQSLVSFCLNGISELKSRGILRRKFYPQNYRGYNIVDISLSTNLFINCSKLPCKVSWIQKRSLIKAIIIRTVRFSVIGGCNDRHFMTINCITSKKIFYFCSNL